MKKFFTATSKKKPVTILLTCCLGDYMKGTIDCYKNNPEGRQIRVIGTDMNDMTYNFVGVDKFYKVSRCDDENYVRELFRICLHEKVDVLIPCNTNELESLSKASYVFDRIGTKVLISDIEGLAIANDKIKSYEFFKENHILTPATLITNSYDELRSFLDENEGKTFVIKQRHGCGSRGFRIIGRNDNLLTEKPSGVFIEDEELKDLLNGEESYLVQEYLSGDEYTVDLVVYKGGTIASFCKLNEDMENGVARKSTIVFNPYCIRQCVDVCKLLKLHGNIGFDLKCNDEGYPVIIDVNPRLTATLSLGAKAGANFPYTALLIALREDIDASFCKFAKEGVSLIRRIEDYYFDKDGDRIG